MGVRQDELEGESKDDHEDDREGDDIVLHGAHQTNVHEDQQPQVVEAAAPVNGEAPPPPSEAPVEPDVPEANAATILVKVYTMGGQNICQQQFHEIDHCTIYGLKKLVAESMNTSPYNIDLMWKHTAVLDDYVVVTRLPRETATNHVSFNVVQSLTKARYIAGKESRREMLILEGADDTASWPSMNSIMSSYMGIVP